ncbi:MAG: AraC family transcriptional regulator [Gammaproteobacteria bacterium]|nr:AraC family transcriptional regulator [Gammaproteobacteria bacterium]
MRTSRASRLAFRGPVTPVEYTPPVGYGLDLEVYPESVLRRRAQSVDLSGVERIEFHCLIHVTAGRYRHMVDFEFLDCAAGSLVVLQPGQVHRFGNMTGWKGWLLVFRSEFLQPGEVRIPIGELELFRQVEALPTRLHTAGIVRQAVTESIERMAEDAKRRVAAPAVNALLRSQLHALLIRLYLAGENASREERIEPMVLQRFRRYRTTVEREYPRWHSVAQYAQHLGCSEKSLSRATTEVADMSAKAFLTNRIVLEAKRLLAHTLTPVASIGDRLGFDEATNFVKFFRRETGTTPGAFRTRHAGG